MGRARRRPDTPEWRAFMNSPPVIRGQKKVIRTMKEYREDKRREMRERQREMDGYEE